jgi:hypothetical protein
MFQESTAARTIATANQVSLKTVMVAKNQKFNVLVEHIQYKMEYI